MIIDSHAHYAFPRFDTEFPCLDGTTDPYTVRRTDRESLLAEMRRHGIIGFIEAGIDPESTERQFAFVDAHTAYMRGSVGFHPTRCIHSPLSRRADVTACAEKYAPIAIGETGLDYHYPRNKQRRLRQKRWFAFQLRLAHERNLPLILHIRDAHKDALRILRKHEHILHGGVVHCFRGDAATAEAYVGLGFALGIGGRLLGNDEDARILCEAVRHIPLSSILVETDAPYVLPDISDVACSNKQRRKLCNSSLILPAVIRKIAELRGEDAQHVETVIFQNTLRIFPMPLEGGIPHA